MRKREAIKQSLETLKFVAILVIVMSIERTVYAVAHIIGGKSCVKD